MIEGRNGSLPEGWVLVELGQICEDVEKVSPKAEPDKEFIYLEIAAIDNSKQKITMPQIYLGKNAPSRARQLVKAGDTLFSTVRTYLRNIAMVDAKYHGQVASTGFCVIRPFEPINKRFIFYLVQTQGFLNPLNCIQRGTSYPAVRNSDVFTQTIALPPVPEQHRIITKTEELFTKLDTGTEALNKIKAQLKRYRQAVLKAAFEGKLTEGWRIKNKDKLESAEALLERIQTEREQVYQQQLIDWKSSGKQGRKPKALKTMVSLTDKELAELPKLPPGWKYERLHNLVIEIADVDHKMPKAQPGGIPYISTKDFYDYESINYELAKKVSVADYMDLCKKIKPEKLDLLLSRYGTIGEVRKVNYEGDFQASYSIAIIKTLKNQSVFIDFLKWGIRSESVQQQIRRYVRATAQPDLGLAHIRQLAVPVPSWAEQVQIVEEIQRYLSIADEAEKVIEHSLKHADKLRQSILKHAFKGKLVPQDRTDEPAEELLKRIKEEKAKLEASGKAKRKSKNKSNLSQMELI